MWSGASQSRNSSTHMAQRCSEVVHVLSAVFDRQQLDCADVEGGARQQPAKSRMLCTICRKEQVFPAPLYMEAATNVRTRQPSNAARS